MPELKLGPTYAYVRLTGFHLQHAGLHQYAREVEDVADALDRAVGDEEFGGARHFDPHARAGDAEERTMRSAHELPENGRAAIANDGRSQSELKIGKRGEPVAVDVGDFRASLDDAVGGTLRAASASASRLVNAS